MGIFKAIGTALQNPDVQDRLAAIGSALQGDTHAAQAYSQHSAQRHASEEAAAKFEAMRDAQAAQITAPSIHPRPGLPTFDNSGQMDSPQAAPMPVPVDVAQLPQLAQAAAAAGAMPVAQAPAAQAPVAPVAQAPSAPTPRSIYAEMLPQLIRASGRGADVSGLLSMLQNEDYVRGLPQKDQAMARAAGASNYANWQHSDNKPVYNETAPGNTWGSYDPVSKTHNSIYTAPARAEPVTTERILGGIIAKRAAGQPLTGGEQAVYDRWENGTAGEREAKAPGTSQIVGSVLSKVTQGGVESLTSGEKLIWDRYNRESASPFGFGGYGGGGADDEEAAAPAAPALRTPPAKLPQKSAQRKPVRSATAPMAGAFKGKDGLWYVKKGAQNFRVDE